MSEDLYSLWEMKDKDEGKKRVKNGVKEEIRMIKASK